MLSARRMIRFALNNPPNFPNAAGDSRDSIYRRSIVIDTIRPKKSTSLSRSPKKRGGYIPEGRYLKGPLDARPADVTFLNIIYAYMRNRTMEESRNAIDGYARKEGRRGVLCGKHANYRRRRPFGSGIMDPK